MSRDPVPAVLIFLSDLTRFTTETKVRFLGCVADYDSGNVLLTHHYPRATATQVVAKVNLDHVLESARPVELQKGAWVNVVGYTVGRSEDPVYVADVGKTAVEAVVCVKAVMLWGDGDLNLDDYEQALQGRKDTGTAA
ncbi:hypothetical protein BT63DRAFT_412425 [Microthyrium microscopicum]|uniref:Uncharacterized protein n=1 Tax=Microthyrium microscopicum TaxID=703497 RepID=A0A6A6UJZ2_9PEZI|nr:hypothetical protein BT63DRAFT_412425 [Microthyrium microscopicum]